MSFDYEKEREGKNGLKDTLQVSQNHHIGYCFRRSCYVIGNADILKPYKTNNNCSKEDCNVV